MQKNIRKLVVSAAIALMSVNPIYASSMELNYDGKKHEYNLPPITLYINNEEVKTEIMPPVQIDGRVLVPGREVFEPLGAAVEWKSYERKIYVSYKDSLMILEPDNDQVWLDGKQIKLDVPAKIINEKIMVPLRFIGENLGFDVKWVSDGERAVYITEGTSKPGGDNPAPLPEEKPETKPETKPEEPETKPETKPESKPTPIEPSAKNRLKNVIDGIKEFYEGKSTSLTVDTSVKSYNMTTIDKASVIGGNTEAVCMIEASTPISEIEVSKSEGKVIIDILNSKNRLASTVQVGSNNFVKQIRTSQFTSDTTRVVLDLKSGAEAFVSLSDDRTGINIQLSKEELSALAIGEDAKGEYLGIEGLMPSQMKVVEDQVNRQVVVTLLNTTLNDDVAWKRIKGYYMDQVYATQKGNNVEITISLQDDVKFTYTVETIKGNTIIRIDKPLFEYIDYVGGNRPTIEVTMPEAFNLKDITVSDLYNENKIIIDLGKNYGSELKTGRWDIGDTIVGAVSIDNGNTTRIIIEEKMIRAANLEKNGQNLTIELVAPKEKYEQIIVLDAGHGGSDSGSTGNGIKEKDVNLNQAKAIKDYIEQNSNIKVYMTREEDVYPGLRDRTNLANQIEADMFISVHNNSFNTESKGTEVLYYPSTTDPRSKTMAEIALKHIVEECGTYNRGVKSRPDLVVLNTSKMPAILLEGAFISNPTEAALLNSATFTQSYGKAVGNAILEMFQTLSFR